MIAPTDLPRLGDVGVDLSVLGFAILAAAASALLFGLVPAARASRPSLLSTLRSGGRTLGLGGGVRLRQGLVAVEVALSFALLVGTGLMVRSFVALTNVDPGFDPNGAIAFTAFNSSLRGYDEGAAYASSLAERLAAIPGVASVTAGMPLPLDGLSANTRWGPMSAADDMSRYQQATGYIVRAGFFAAMKTRILAGHDFTAAENVQGNRVIIIDELAAAKAFPGKRPDEVIGQSILARIITPEAVPFRVIGVVQHQRHETLTGHEQEAVYLGEGTVRQPAQASRWVVRTAGDLDALAREIPQAVAAIAPRVPVVDLKPMTSYVDRAMAPTRFALVLIGIFGVVALALAAIGLYGVVSTTVRQRTAEIGVRMAFGATHASIFRLIIGQGVLVSLAGVAAGLIAALALSGAMSRAGMLVSVRATDPMTYVAMAAVFALVAAVACWRPARRAARLDPMVALRDD
jgi:putative ABC transport system permease protein